MKPTKQPKVEIRPSITPKNMPPEYFESYMPLPWIKAIQGRRSFIRCNLGLQFSRSKAGPDPDLIDIMTLAGDVGGTHYEIKLDSNYTQGAIDIKKEEMKAVVKAYLNLVKKLIHSAWINDESSEPPESFGELTDKDLAIASFDVRERLAKEYSTPFNYIFLGIGETPNSQILPTPDVIQLNVLNLQISLDKLYRDELKLKAKAEMLIVLDAFEKSFQHSMELLGRPLHATPDAPQN